jgi:hypothetical protein
MAGDFRFFTLVQCGGGERPPYGKTEPAMARAILPVALTVTHAGIIQVEQYRFSMP